MRTRSFAAALAFALAFHASASMAAPATADVKVDVQAPAGVLVYDSGQYHVVVSNIGKKPAAGVVLAIALPTTHTSPSVYLMGTLGAYDGRCSLAPSGTALTCGLGTLAKGASTTVWFDIELPQSSAPLVVNGSATTSSADGNPANNSDAATAALLHHDVPLAGGEMIRNEHCTGTGLTAWFECTLFPSSVSFHDTQLNAGGSITFVNPTSTLTGSWWQPSDDRLMFTYLDGIGVVAAFDGYGVNGTCFEGLTTFPGSTYVAPYSVCILP